MNELQTILGETCARLFTDRAPASVLEAAEKGEWPAGLWQALEENGLTLPQVPEARGGAGGSWSDAFVVLRAAGRFAAPVPLAETMLAGAILAEAGLDAPLGPMTVAPTDPNERLTLARRGGAFTLSGRAIRVPWGARAEHVVVVADAEGSPMIALVAGGQAKAEADGNLAREPRDTLTWSASPVVAAAPLRGRLGPQPVWAGGALVRSAQMAGGLEFLLAQSVKYVTERKQFGRPLAAFQTIQQNLALLAGHTAAAAMAAQQAFHAVERAGERAGEDGDATFEIAVAKVRTGEAAGLGAGIAHQAHGAIGFTYEHSLHFVTRRLWSWRAEFGAESHWSVALGRAVAARGGEALWPHMTSR